MVFVLVQKNARPGVVGLFAKTLVRWEESGRAMRNAHAGSRTRVTSMGGLYDAATLHAPVHPGVVWLT